MKKKKRIDTIQNFFFTISTFKSCALSFLSTKAIELVIKADKK